MKILYLLCALSLLCAVENEIVLTISVVEKKIVYIVGSNRYDKADQSIIEYKKYRSSRGQQNGLILAVDSDEAKLAGIRIGAMGMMPQGECGPFYVTSFKGSRGYTVSEAEEEKIRNDEIPKEFMRLSGVPEKVIQEIEQKLK